MVSVNRRWPDACIFLAPRRRTTDAENNIARIIRGRKKTTDEVEDNEEKKRERRREEKKGLEAGGCFASAWYLRRHFLADCQ